MIFETDQALATMIKTKVLGGAQVAIAFDPPSRPWIQALRGPTINVFLFDLKENTSRRDVMYEEIRNDQGVIVARRPPPRRWDLHYTITVWGVPQVLVEHKVLALVLRYFSSIDVLPRDVLPPALAQMPYEIVVGSGAGMKRGMFLNMAGDMKAGFEIVVAVPMPPPPPPPAAPPVQQTPQVSVGPVPGQATAPGAVAPVETVPGGPPRQPAAVPQAPAPAPAAAAGRAPAAAQAAAPVRAAGPAAPAGQAPPPEADPPEARAVPDQPAAFTAPSAPPPARTPAAAPPPARPPTAAPPAAAPAAAPPAVSPAPEPNPSGGES